MKNARLIYRVILKILTTIALIVLLVVFLSSLFTGAPDESVNNRKRNEVAMIAIDISELKRGEIKKARWNGKEVAVLHRQKLLSTETKGVSKPVNEAINSVAHSLSPEFFVYINSGDSRNCPLFYAKDNLKDVCSSTLFDTAGRQKNNPLQGFQLEIPPHYFEGKMLLIGRWDKLGAN